MKRRRFWSEDQIKKIKKLYDVDRLSFSMIAKELNTTKNSIIGVYWRYRKKNNIFIIFCYTAPSKAKNYHSIQEANINSQTKLQIPTVFVIDPTKNDKIK